MLAQWHRFKAAVTLRHVNICKTPWKSRVTSEECLHKLNYFTSNTRKHLLFQKKTMKFPKGEWSYKATEVRNGCGCYFPTFHEYFTYNKDKAHSCYKKYQLYIEKYSGKWYVQHCLVFSKPITNRNFCLLSNISL